MELYESLGIDITDINGRLLADINEAFFPGMAETLFPEVKKSAQIIDFSDEVPELPNSYNFNPSIAWLKDNFYLVSYRQFVRYPELGSVEEYSPTLDPQHPWLGGDRSTTWWNRLNGEDNTGFFIGQLIEDDTGDDFNFSFVKRLKLPIVCKGDDGTKCDLYHLEGVDTRIARLGVNKYLISYNVWADGRFKILARTGYIRDSKLYLGKENDVCPQISQPTEKNWSFWTYKGDVYFSYGLSPRHTVYKVNIDDDSVRCVPSVVKESGNYYEALERYYNRVLGDDKYVFVSVTTPAIQNPEGNYVGVGHIKYKTTVLRDTPGAREGNIYRFYNQTQGLDRHPVYDYLMFFYEFDPENGRLVSVSDAFIPSETTYSLSFPSGITMYNGKYVIVTYGDHDSQCKMIIFPSETVRKLLARKNPNELGFYMMPEKCFDKTGICSDILK